MNGMPPQPVMIEQVRRCHFEAKPCGLCGLPKRNRVHTPRKTATCAWRRQNGCATCGGNKNDPVHFGEPPSLNFFATGNRTGQVFGAAKRDWQRLLLGLLVESPLPTGLDSVLVEGEITFPTHARRDQGNFRVIVEKALGDALKEGGYLSSDDWDRYEFGGLAYRVVPGESATRLTIFPMAATAPEQMELA